MLKELIFKYGKRKLNTLTKYPSILTLHKIGDKGRLTEELTTQIDSDETYYATEKIDGTNVRIITYGNEMILGSREFLLYHSDDLFYDPAQGIVEYLYDTIQFRNNFLTVVYGEMYGGKVSSNSKQYGTEKNGFRIFDIALFKDLSILESPLEEISTWRELETPEGMRYGQPFVDIQKLKSQVGYELAPSIEFKIGDTSAGAIYDAMRSALPHTKVALTESALLRPEGLVVRNEDRSKIFKLRFEDYERTFRK